MVIAAAIAGQTASAAGKLSLNAADAAMLNDLEYRSFLYFSEHTNLRTGLTLDRARTDEPGRQVGIASISATGFALTSYCVAQDHHWISRAEAKSRVLTSLTFLAQSAPREHGWFYHFMDAQSGRRTPRSELSSIDTAMLLAGVLTARACFADDAKLVKLATQLYDDIDFPWMMNGSTQYLSLGWSPESGFLRSQWSAYSELLVLYVLAIGSPSHPISAGTWEQWKHPVETEGGLTYVGGGPLFIHQYPLAWLNLRDRTVEAGTNYFQNSIIATRAQRQAFLDQLAPKFPGYTENIWGLTASDSPKGYVDWGWSPDDIRIDGTVAPSAAAGSLMLTPDISLPAVRAMLKLYGKKVYGRYGFVDAFNPTTGWVGRDVVGLAAGITLVSAENLRTEKVWRWFMSNPEPRHALDAVGLAVHRKVQ